MRYYLTSLAVDAPRLAAVRGHWSARTVVTGCWMWCLAKITVASAPGTPPKTSRCCAA
ncbi:MAG: hypothetical protein U0Y68_23160 [Blastocatellia bacterium]